MTSPGELWWLLPGFHNLPRNSHSEGERQDEMPNSHLTTPKTLHLAQTKTDSRLPACIVSYPPNFSLAPTMQLLFACVLCLGSAFCVSMHKASSSVTRLTFLVFHLVLYCSTVLTSFSCVCGGSTHAVVHTEKSKENTVSSPSTFTYISGSKATKDITTLMWLHGLRAFKYTLFLLYPFPPCHKIMIVVNSNQECQRELQIMKL